MNHITLTIGPPGVGKNTWATEIVRKSNVKTIVVNRDDYRAMSAGGNIQNYKFNSGVEDMITKAQFQSAKIALDKGWNVIVADTNLNPKTVAAWEDFAKTNKVKVIKQDFFVEFLSTNQSILADRGIKGVIEAFRKKCHTQNLIRSNSVPPDVINKMINDYIVPAYYKPKQYTGTPGKPKAILVDLDGTTFHMNDRGPFEWDRVGEDTPDKTVIETCQIYAAAGWKIVAASGRDGSCYVQSRSAMDAAGMPYDAFFIRKTGDQRPDYLVKEEIFWRDIAPNYDITFALDDRDQVVQQYREMGIKVYQVAEGNF